MVSVKTTAMTIALTSMIAGSVASADSIDLSYNGIVGGGSAAHARIGSHTYLAGHMTHTITSGARAGQSFNTFCIEVEEHANGGSSTYQIVNLADAPDPGADYGQVKADSVSAIIANAQALGWIDSKMQADSNDSLYLARMGAIQAAVWEALGHDFQASSGSTSSSMSSQYSILMNSATFDGSLRMRNLVAVVATGEQDMLYIVPLPTSALAGMGMLMGIAGVRSIRRRR